MASIPFQGTVPSPHHVDEEQQPEEEAEEADPEEQAVALILLEEARLGSRRLPARRNSHQRSCGEVGPDRPSAEAPTMLSLRRRASYAGSPDISHETVLTAATREDLVQQSDRNVL